tara:strand:- start:545 stop:739 length:195 start_codon:yes stop_codon:yes gene_type:complete
MKWYEKFSCNSNCKFNPEKECPREMWEVLWDLNHLELCDKDLKNLAKIFKKNSVKIENLQKRKT